MAKSLDYYDGLAKESEKEYSARNKVFEKIDEIDLCKYTAPQELSALPWWKTIKVMAPRDALKSASRALATIMPKIEIQPLNASEGELDRVEVIERVLEWQFHQMNRRGVRYPLWDIVNSALKYMMVCIQPVYIPHFLKGKNDPRVDYLKKNGDFVWKIHNPQNVFPRYDDYGLLNVVLSQDMTIDQLKGQFAGNKGLTKLLSRFDEKNDTDIGNTKVKYKDYTDWTDRACWIDYEGEKYELERGEHGLPFLNWVIRQGDDPLLKGLVDSGAYDVVNLLASLRYALVVGVVSHPATATKTFSGESPEVDYTDPSGNIPLKPGEDISPVHPRVLDPHLSEILNEEISAIHASTVARALGTLEFAGNMPFATVNAILQSAVASLSVPRRVAETAIEDGFYINLQWGKYAKQPLSGYRMVSRETGERTLGRGAALMIKPEDVQASNINITVELRADTATDKAERTNRAINWHSQLQVPLKTCYEEIGIENFDVQQSEFTQEQLVASAVQNRLYKMSLQAQDEMKQQVMQEFAQKMAEEEQMRQQQAENPAFATAQGQGNNPAEGGATPFQTAPNQTREAITGQTFTGEETAGV